MSKRILTLILLIAVGARLYALDFVYDNFKFSTTDVAGECVCTGTTLTIGDLLIPQTAYAPDGTPYTVTAIGEKAFMGDRFFGSDFNGRLEIPATVREIGEYAFYRCPRMKGPLSLPAGLTYLGRCAFANCRMLQGGLELPKGLTSIEDSIFQNCEVIDGSIIIPEGITSIGRYAFDGCEKISGELRIPESVTEIGTDAFNECYKLTGRFKLPSGLKVLENGAFGYCMSLTGPLVIPDGITEINNGVFVCCYAILEPPVIPESVTVIRNDAFSGCHSMVGELALPKKLTYVGDRAFGACEKLTGALVIPSGVTYIGEGAFAGCGEMSGSLTLPEELITIGRGAFWSCSNLSGPLVLPESLEVLGPHAFYNCRKLTGLLEIPQGVTVLNKSVFELCSGLTGPLNIPEHITGIGENAFRGCSGFTGELTIPEGITAISPGVFYGCSGLTGNLNIPAGVKTIGSNAFRDCRNLTGELVIPEGVTSIGASAFYGCSGLGGELRIPSGVTSLSEAVFQGCSGLSGELVIPATVTSVGASAFSGCSGFTGPLIIPDGVAEIGVNAFAGCDGLSTPVVSYGAEPPLLQSANGQTSLSGLAFLAATRDIYVEKEDLEKYAAAAVWKEYDVKPIFDDYLELDCGSLVLPDGGSHEMSVMLISFLKEPVAADVDWISSDPAVASVTGEGKVAALAPGTATIAAVAKDGSGLTAECSLTVAPVMADGIALDRSSLELTVGEGARLTATVTPAYVTDGSVAWSSDNETVATVDGNGAVATHGIGTATVTATTVNGLSAQCIVAVNPVVVPADGISLNLTEVELTEGDGMRLMATVTPADVTDGSVRWRSDNVSVATVDGDGRVAALGAGVATITATTANGLSAGCRVTVNKLIIPAGGIALDMTEAVLSEGDEMQLTATVTPADVTDGSVTWRSSNDNVATVDGDGRVTALRNGVAVITATTANGLRATCRVTVNLRNWVCPGMYLSRDEIVEEEGASIRLVATVVSDNPADATLTWSSDNESVAAVDGDGNVMALRSGTAVITATTGGGMSARCTVRVLLKGAAIGTVGGDSADAVRVEGSSIIAPEGSVVYDLAGRRMRPTALRPGIYIVRTPSGTTAKLTVGN